MWSKAWLGWTTPARLVNLVASFSIKPTTGPTPHHFQGDTSRAFFLPVLSCRLMGFCDASKSAYVAVVYLLIESECGPLTWFVACKTRVSPVKGQTIPCLELLPTLLLSKLMTSVTRALELELSLGEPSYFTDSKVALYWVKGQEKALYSKSCQPDPRSDTNLPLGTFCRKRECCQYPIWRNWPNSTFN